MVVDVCGKVTRGLGLVPGTERCTLWQSVVFSVMYSVLGCIVIAFVFSVPVFSIKPRDK